MRAINSVRMTVLPSPAPPNRPALPPRTNGVKQVDHLDAGLEDFGLGREVGHLGRVAVDGPVVLGLDRPAVVDRLAEQIEDAAERGLADRHLDGRAGVDALHAADHAVGAAQGDAAHAAAAEVLLHLAGEVELDALLLGCRSSRRCRSPAGWSSGNSASNVEPMTWVTRPRLVDFGGGGSRHARVNHAIELCYLFSFSASAPPIISNNSPVICPCRARL